MVSMLGSSRRLISKDFGVVFQYTAEILTWPFRQRLVFCLMGWGICFCQMVMVMMVGVILEDFAFNWGKDLMGVILCIRLFGIESPNRIGRRRQYLPVRAESDGVGRSALARCLTSRATRREAMR
jgi:hypothetical protein